MIVEFIGTPGAGKTTLLPAVCEFFNERGFNAFSVVEAARPFAARTLPGRVIGLLAPASLRRPLLWQLFYQLSTLYRQKFLRENRMLIQTLLRFQRSRPISTADREHVLGWFFHLVGCREFLKAHARPEDVLIFDEGFIHRVVQLFASEAEEPDPATIADYIDLLPQPSLVVYPRASLRTCQKRVWDRGVWERFRGKSPAEICTFIANSHAVVSFAVNYVRSLGWTVIAVDNDGDDPAASKAQLQRQLSNLFGCTSRLSDSRVDTAVVPRGV